MRGADHGIFLCLAGLRGAPGPGGAAFDPGKSLPPEKFEAYVLARKSLSAAESLWAPALRHIDPFFSPAPMWFGSGRLDIEHDAKTHFREGEKVFYQHFFARLWNRSRNQFRMTLGCWSSNRINTALALRSDNKGADVTLNTPLGRAAE